MDALIKGNDNKCVHENDNSKRLPVTSTVNAKTVDS